MQIFNQNMCEIEIKRTLGTTDVIQTAAVVRKHRVSVPALS